MHPILRALMPLAVVVCVGGPVAAQEAAPPAPLLRGMFTVDVLDRSGAETRGSLVSLTASAVVVSTETGARTIALGDVVRIYRRGDSLRNGAIIGAVVGGLIGGALASCTTSSDPQCTTGTRVAMVLTSIGVWAAIGAGIDALIPGRTLIWTPGSTAATGGLTMEFSPENRRAFIGWTMTMRGSPGH